MTTKEVILKVILNNKRKTKIKVKEVLKTGSYLLIDGSVVGKDEVLETIEEKV